MSTLDDVHAKLESIKRAHELLCAQQDLSLEVAPRDSRFSTQLSELMRKEESLAKDPESAAFRTVVQRVDDTLRQETQQFFARVVHQNVKKWEGVKQNLDKDIQRLNKQIQAIQMQDIAPSRPTTAPSVASNALAAEEERLLVDYYRNWHQYETFHLREAFVSQHARIDRDWGNHEKNLRAEYDAKRESLGAQSSAAAEAPSPNTPTESGGTNKWHHPEKQKALIHTAPVFTPSVCTGARGASATKREKSGSKVSELQKVDKEFQDALRTLVRQKGDAKRWLHRQQLRLEAQCVEVQHEKQYMGEIYENHFRNFRQFSSRLRPPAPTSTPQAHHH